PRKPCRRLSPSAPAIQTIGFELPSVVVTIGAARPSNVPHHAIEIDGDGRAAIRSASTSGFATGRGHPTARACTATNTALPAGKLAGAVRIGALAICLTASAPPIPPRSLRFSRYALPSLPSASTNWVLPLALGTSSGSGFVAPRS